MDSQHGDTSSGRVRRDPRDSTSLLREDDLSRFRKKFFFPNDVVMRLPASSDRINAPPPGFIGVYETLLRAGLRFPPAPELLDILHVIGVSLSQLSARAMMILSTLIVLFREHGGRLTPEALVRFGEFSSVGFERLSFNSPKFVYDAKENGGAWMVDFFYIKNDWGLSERWSKPLKLPRDLGLVIEDIIFLLGFKDFKELQLEIRSPRNFLTEERLRKAQIFVDVKRSLAIKGKIAGKGRPSPPSLPLKRRSRDEDCENIPVDHGKKISVASSLQQGDRAQEGRKKVRKEEVLPQERRAKEIVSPTDQEMSMDTLKTPQSGSSKIPIPESVLLHTCTGFTRHKEMVSKREEYDRYMEEWNTEFVKIKYLNGKHQSLYEAKCKEFEEMKTQLMSCQLELATSSTSNALMKETLDSTQEDLIEARSRLRESTKSMAILSQKASDLEEEVFKLKSDQEKDVAVIGAAAVETFKGSFEFKELIHNARQETRDHIYDVEVVALQRESQDDGFIRGFYKGVRALQRRGGEDAGGLSPSQASEDPTPPSDEEDEEDVVSGLQEGQTEEEIDTADE